jgi:hypothetical protein
MPHLCPRHRCSDGLHMKVAQRMARHLTLRSSGEEKYKTERGEWLCPYLDRVLEKSVDIQPPYSAMVLCESRRKPRPLTYAQAGSVRLGTHRVRAQKIIGWKVAAYHILHLRHRSMRHRTMRCYPRSSPQEYHQAFLPTHLSSFRWCPGPPSKM